MTDKEMLLAVENVVRQELNRVANEEIEKLVHKFRCELGKHKGEIVGKLINGIEMLSTKDLASNSVIFQINIKGGADNVEKNTNL